MIIRSIIVSLILVLAGCATVFKGTKQSVTINSNVDGAEIFLDGEKVGVTPFSGKIKKDKSMIILKKEGYKDQALALNTRLEGAFWATVILGGPFSMTTDLSNGSAYAYRPSSYQIDLEKVNSNTAQFKKKYNLRKFAMINMSKIAIDLSNGTGEYLSTLLTLSEKKVNEENILIVSKYFNESQGDQIIFGQLIVKNLLSV
jgi:uncharacterized protein YceK